MRGLAIVFKCRRWNGRGIKGQERGNNNVVRDEVAKEGNEADELTSTSMWQQQLDGSGGKQM